MANEQNLEPMMGKNRGLSTEEARRLGSIGGKKSAEVRKERKLLKQSILDALSEGDTQNNIIAALLEKAMSGDTKAFEVIRDTIGEKEADKVEVDGGMGFYLDGIGDDISG